MLDIPDVELDPFRPREPRAPVHLRPARQPRVDFEAPPLVGGVLLNLVRERRTRPDDRHLTAEDVPELRQLVDREAAQDAADARDPRVALVDGPAGALPLG